MNPKATPEAPTLETKHSSLHGVVITLLMVSLLLNAFSVSLLMGYPTSLNSLLKGKEGNNPQTDSAVGIRKILLDLEYEKVGGKENYDVLQKYSQMQIKEQIAQIKSYVDGGAAPGTQADAKGGTITSDELKKITDDANIEGNKAASILVIEYSDMECPFCMKQYHDTKLFPSLLSQYGDKIALAFKNNRGVNHKGTEVKALGALCAAKLGGDVAYQKFYKGVMDGSTNEGGVLEVSTLPNIAKIAGVDSVKWQACVDNKETLSRFTAQTNEAQKYGLGGTPGTLIVNVKTGNYAVVEGAYPYATFTAKIDELMK